MVNFLGNLHYLTCFFWKIALKEMLTEEMGFEAAANRLELLCVSHAPK